MELSKRDAVALKTLEGIVRNTGLEDVKELVELAFAYADEFVKRSEEKKKPNKEEDLL